MTPDIKKIAAEMREFTQDSFTAILSADKLRAWADALDPQPTMPVEEARYNLQKYLINGSNHPDARVFDDAVRSLLAHYEATTKQPTPAPGELATIIPVTQDLKTAIERLARAMNTERDAPINVGDEWVMHTKSFNAGLLRDFFARCVVRP